MKNRKYRAALFDLDGTLLDTLDDLADAANRVLASMGMPVHQVEEYKYFVGDGLATLIERIVPAGQRDEETMHRVIDAFRRDYGVHWHVKSRPYAGVAETLTGLQNLGMRLAVLSNKPHDFTELCVKRMLGDFSFYPILGQREGVPKKPDPAGAIEAAALLDTPVTEILYFGDTSIDMKTATEAGMTVVGVLWGFRDEEELAASGADYLIRHPGEILDLLTG
ncbi:MAG TPA: HAD family hydrolase [Desulfobulbus sp.]|nr:HAD family hydrolase [Desulfobulbus sp.]